MKNEVDIETYKKVAWGKEEEAIASKEAEIAKKRIEASSILANGNLGQEEWRQLGEIAEKMQSKAFDIDNAKKALIVIEGWENETWKEEYDVENFNDLPNPIKKQVCDEILAGVHNLNTREAVVYAYYATQNMPAQFQRRVSDACKDLTGLDIEDIESEMAKIMGEVESPEGPETARKVTIDEVGDVAKEVPESLRGETLKEVAGDVPTRGREDQTIS